MAQVVPSASQKKTPTCGGMVSRRGDDGRRRAGSDT